MENKEKLVGKEVIITDRNSWAHGEWGIVNGFDGEYYYIGIAGDKKVNLAFTRNEFRVRRNR